MPPNTPEEMPSPPPPLDGDLRLDEVTRKGRDDDFGHIVHHMPEGVLRPGSADDVATTIQWTAQRGRKFALQGQRHSTFGRSQVPNGIVADMSTLRYIGAVEDDRVVVEAGAKTSAAILTSLSRNLRIRDPTDVGFLTGIAAVILVDVATQDREGPADSRDMYMVHAMCRREFAALPTLVRGVAAADAERADLIAEHTGLLTAVLEARHRAEDTDLWPRLLDRGGEDLGRVVDVMEEQHERIEQLTAQAVVALAEWREDPAAERRTRLADALDRLHAALYTHMGIEEQLILPLAEKYATAAEWHAMAAASGAARPAGTMPLVFGMTLYEADPELIQNTVSSLSPEGRTLLAQQGPQQFAAHSERARHTHPRGAVRRYGAPRDDHSSHIKFRSIRRRNSNDS